MSFSESLFHGKPRIKCPLLSPQKMLKKKHRHYLEKILYLWTLFGHGKTFSRKLPTTLGAGTGGTAAPVIHCFGAQRAVEKPRSENEANSHWSVLKTRAFWSCFSLRNSFCVFLWLFFFEIAIGFLASSSSMKAPFISFKLSNDIYVTCQSTPPWRKKNGIASSSITTIFPPPLFAHSAWHHWRYHISHRQSAAMGDPCRSLLVRTAEHLKRSRS